MGSTFRLGHIKGVSIRASWTVFVIVWLLMWSLAAYTLPRTAPGYSSAIYWAVGLLAALGLLAAILAHELSHAMTANRHGVAVEQITLWMFGGVATLSERAQDARTELRIAVSGPAMSIAIGVSSLVSAAVSEALGGPKVLTVALGWFGLINVVLALFNLLPGAPLDGGRVLAAALWWRSGDAHAARRQAAHAGRILGQVLIGLGVASFLVGGGLGGVWIAMIGWFLTTSARREEQLTDVESAFEGVRVADVMTADVKVVHGGQTVADLVLRNSSMSHVSSFPIVDRDGRLEGLVTLRQLRQVPREAWETTSLSDVAVPRERLVIARTDEPLLGVLRRAGGGDGRVLVVTDGQLVGIITPTDVTRAIERLSLTRT